MNIRTAFREKLLACLILLQIISFTLSYALSSITCLLLLVFFFVDEKSNISKKIKRIFKDKLVMTYMLFFLAQLIGCFYSENIGMAFRRTEIMLPLLFMPAILSVEQLSKKCLGKLLDVIKCAVPFIFILLLIYHVAFLRKEINTFVNFTITEVVGVSQFYLVFVVLLPIIECIRKVIIGKQVVLHIGILLINLAIVFLLGNKTSLIITSVLMLFLVVKLLKNKRKKALTIFLILCGAIVLVTQLDIAKNKINVFLKTTDFNFKTIVTKNKYAITKNTAEHRILIDYVALNAINRALPFGYGTGDYLNELYKGYSDLEFKAGAYYEYNTHNQYLSEFLKTGIIGGFLFLFLMLQLIKKVNVKNLYSFAVVFFAFACCFESYLFRHHGVIIFGFLLPFVVYNTHKLND